MLRRTRKAPAPELVAPRGAVDRRGALEKRWPGDKPPGRGRPLEPDLRGDLEGSFGFDFASVRIHDDPLASGLVERLGARAMTVGRHIAFSADQFRPDSRAGRRLLAHELAHVVQQSRGVASGQGRATALEADADRAAQRAVGGGGALGELVRLASPLAPAFERRRSAAAGRSGPGVVDRATTEARVQSEVQRLRSRIPESYDVTGMMMFDSNFYGDNGLFDFRGHVMRGWEVNYYFISMAMAHQRYSWSSAQDMIWAWNTTQYVLPGDPDMTDEMWFAAREGFNDEVARLPPLAPTTAAPFSSPPFTCFTGDTPVLLADGREVPIHRLGIGEAVLAVDQGSGQVVVAETTARHVHPGGRVRVLRLANGRHQQVTSNHPVFAGGAWVAAGTLGAGDLLATPSQDSTELASVAIEAVDETGFWADALYDITVAPHHNFFAAGALVHNKLP